MAKRDLILHNFGWKLLSLLLAGLTWMAIWTALQKDRQKERLLQESPVVSTRSFAVPITLLTRTASAGQFVVTPASAEVEVSGKARDPEKLQVPQLYPFVEFTDAPEVKQFLPTIQ